MNGCTTCLETTNQLSGSNKHGRFRASTLCSRVYSVNRQLYLSKMLPCAVHVSFILFLPILADHSVESERRNQSLALT
ncbi:hypothetical protein BD310DRAFT_925228 [Dichomitus squalens]|uniref:Uncharacterized protein n=1 Tax=Dichomitus squalens TaxID=114155 RepID=A0A4Q9PXI5_9APHY|nr:hypothetical protein BD310DRAFT_925228 [Dichomitus squalens]